MAVQFSLKSTERNEVHIPAILLAIINRKVPYVGLARAVPPTHKNFWLTF